jgi:hypothetical protein
MIWILVYDVITIHACRGPLYWLFVMPNDSGTPLSFPTNAGTRAAYARIMRLNDKIVVPVSASAIFRPRCNLR